MKNRLLIIIFVAIVGFIDATYLTVQHYVNRIPPCTLHGCETVLTSKYAAIGPLPVALLGAVYYAIVLVMAVLMLKKGTRRWSLLMVVMSLAMIATLGFVYLQGFVIHAWCQYCLLSAATTTTLFLLVIFRRPKNSPQQLP